MLMGREAELARLRAAILARESLLISGPAASGKSALLEEAIASLPGTLRARCLVCRSAAPPHAMWIDLLRSLLAASDPAVVSRVETEAESLSNLNSWLHQQTSLRLRGILHRATCAAQYYVFFDPPQPLPDSLYRTLQFWMWSKHTPVYLTARSCDSAGAGRAARLFWHDGLRLPLGPLDRASAESLLHHCVQQFALSEVADEEFCAFILSQSRMLPGAIVHLCELASQPEYRFQGRLKLHTLAVDSLLHLAEIAASVAQRPGRG